PVAPMVLPSRGGGRVGRRQPFLQTPGIHTECRASFFCPSQPDRPFTGPRDASHRRPVALISLSTMPSSLNPLDPATLERLQRQTFAYFLDQSDPVTGLVADKNRPGWPASIAATGLALAAYPVGVERQFLSRAEAVRRCLTVLRFLRDAPQDGTPVATGHRGFYYHFLDMRSGRRAWRCELSTVDSGFLLAGALAAARYFTAEDPEERELVALA